MYYPESDIKMAKFLKSKGFNYIARDRQVMEGYPSDLYAYQEPPIKAERGGFISQRVMNAIFPDEFYDFKKPFFKAITFKNSPVAIDDILNDKLNTFDLSDIKNGDKVFTVAGYGIAVKLEEVDEDTPCEDIPFLGMYLYYYEVYDHKSLLLPNEDGYESFVGLDEESIVKVVRPESGNDLCKYNKDSGVVILDRLKDMTLDEYKDHYYGRTK